ncbi:hypothetical protein [Virgibacillus sp. CBA3643]|uniref:hypothetical protein n=1 Tax=Virgibacillus sp. CBA3643 TaxID=2942278 RepID=UPI0035A2CCA9
MGDAELLQKVIKTFVLNNQSEKISLDTTDLKKIIDVAVEKRLVTQNEKQYIENMVIKKET